MEDFYPLRIGDILKLSDSKLVQECLKEIDRWGQQRKENAISFLLPLVIDLLDNVERSRSLKNAFQEKYAENSNAKISDGLWNVVKAYLEENNGTGNLLRITEVLRSNAYLEIAKVLEIMLLRYSFLASSTTGETCLHAYTSSSSDQELLEADETDIARNSAVVSTLSVEKALTNPVILEKIFEKLGPQDQKLFRLVCQSWMEDTFSLWRKKARIVIRETGRMPRMYYRNDSSSEEEDEESKHGISLSLYLDLWEKNNKEKMLEGAANAEGNDNQQDRKIENTENYNLEDHPFRSYKVSYNDCRSMSLFSFGEMETKFWKLCGPYIENLKFEGCWCNTENCNKLLQEFCPNLKRLDLSGTHWKNTPQVNEEETKIAEKLHTLIIENINEECLKSLLFICPNLKTLSLSSDKVTLGALLSPAFNGEFIKLKYLVLNTNLYIARSPPFHAALTQASKNLKTLDLVFEIDDEGIEETRGWIIELSPLEFLNLSKLSFKIDYDYLIDPKKINFYVKFDFGSLKGLPMLEKLEISVKNDIGQDVVARKPGTQDWVFEGDRYRYFPTGLVVNYQYPVEAPILCRKLKQFVFDGWSLNDQDVKLLSSWFPNLTHLEAEVSPETLSIVMHIWERLEKIVIHTEKLISLRRLWSLKERKKNLEILQRISTMEIDKKLFELKEQNGLLHFSQRDL